MSSDDAFNLKCIFADELLKNAKSKLDIELEYPTEAYHCLTQAKILNSHLREYYSQVSQDIINTYEIYKMFSECDDNVKNLLEYQLDSLKAKLIEIIKLQKFYSENIQKKEA